MRIALVDDNEQERNHALPLLFQGFQELNIPLARLDFYEDAESFLNHWILGSYDLIILDIMLGTDSGIDLAHEIRKKSKDVRIVFASSSNEYACESYAVNASFYIQKPVTLNGIHDMIRRLNITDYELRRFIVLPDTQKVILRNIIYTEYYNHQIQIHMKQGEVIKTWLSQKAFLELLHPYQYFLACNKGSIVNMYEIANYQPDLITMSDQSVVSVSRRKIKDSEAAYKHFLFSSIREDF